MALQIHNPLLKEHHSPSPWFLCVLLLEVVKNYLWLLFVIIYLLPSHHTPVSSNRLYQIVHFKKEVLDNDNIKSFFFFKKSFYIMQKILMNCYKKAFRFYNLVYNSKVFLSHKK